MLQEVSKYASDSSISSILTNIIQGVVSQEGFQKAFGITSENSDSVSANVVSVLQVGMSYFSKMITGTHLLISSSLLYLLGWSVLCLSHCILC